MQAGQVGVSTDTGHQGSLFDSSWASGRPERVRDFGWRAVHLMTVAAKRLIRQFYGRGPEHAYFIGCSNGGRQGLMEAARFPEDYDGIVAGAPVALPSELVRSMSSTVQAQLPLGAAIRPDQIAGLQNETLRQCDGGDGQLDGLVSDPRQCHVDLTVLACSKRLAFDCLSSAQLAALALIQAGRAGDDDHARVAGYPLTGAEVGAPITTLGWESWIAYGQLLPNVHALFVTGFLQDIAPEPIGTPETFDFERDSVRVKAAFEADLDVAPHLDEFFARGGKLIMWHGWADPAVPPQLTLDYHRSLVREPGSAEATRLFMVPGVQHCANGPGPDLLGQYGAPASHATPERSLGAAIQAWVEADRVPESLVAGFGYAAASIDPDFRSERERLICAYPAQARLRPGQNPNVGASYQCGDPRYHE